MDDPTHRAKGWAIGSGPVEAACEQVVNQRLQVTGAVVGGRRGRGVPPPPHSYQHK